MKLPPITRPPILKWQTFQPRFVDFYWKCWLPKGLSLSLPAYLPVPRYLAQELHALLPYVQAEVLHAVAHDEVGHLQNHVVAAYLVEGLLADADVRSLELHDDERAPVMVVEYGIGTALHAVLLQAYLVPQAGQGVAQMLRHPVREMLPHPFLGREHHPAAAHKVPDVEAFLAPFQSYVGRGEVQFQHRCEIWSKEGGVLLPIHSFCLSLHEQRYD